MKTVLRLLQIGSFALAIGALALVFIVNAEFIAWFVIISIVGWIIATLTTILRSKQLHATNKNHAANSEDPFLDYARTVSVLDKEFHGRG